VESPDLVGSWVRFERLRAAGAPAGTLDELVGSAAAPPPAIAPPTAAPTRRTTEPRSHVDVAAIEAAAAVAPPELPLMDITALLYRGARALARAQELRDEARAADPARLKALIEEVCDLVALAHDAGG
jgi:hypothetical protein